MKNNAGKRANAYSVAMNIRRLNYQRMRSGKLSVEVWGPKASSFYMKLVKFMKNIMT